jgi:hypothetical protein
LNGTLAWKRLHEVTTDIYSFGAYELTNQIRFVEPGLNTVPFINVTEIGNLYVDISQARHIDVASHRLLHKSVCFPGTVLLSMSGSIGRVAVVPGYVKECNSNQHLAKIVVDKEKSDPYFIAAYFAASVGQASCNREAAGAVQKELYLYNISSLPVPHPSRTIRLAISNKVRVAEKLREQATACEIESITKLNGLIGSEDQTAIKPSTDGSCGYFAKQVLATDLAGYFGAQLYAPKRQHAVQLVRSARSPITTLGAQGIRVKSKGKSNQSRTHIDPMQVYGSNGYWDETSISDGSDVVLAKPGYVLLLRMRPYLNKTTIVDIEETVSTSPEFLIYRFKERDDAFYATLCLRQPWALAQVAEIATGDRPRVDGEFVDEIILPWPVHGERSQIGQLYKESFAARRQADTLVKAAIADVEHLIEGKLDETACLEEGRQLAEEFGFENP